MGEVGSALFYLLLSAPSEESPVRACANTKRQKIFVWNNSHAEGKIREIHLEISAQKIKLQKKVLFT